MSTLPNLLQSSAQSSGALARRWRFIRPGVWRMQAAFITHPAACSFAKPRAGAVVRLVRPGGRVLWLAVVPVAIRALAPCAGPAQGWFRFWQ